jgi:hypothetical protein
VAGSQVPNPGVPRGAIVGIAGLVLVLLAGIAWRIGNSADGAEVEPAPRADAHAGAQVDVQARTEHTEEVLTGLGRAWAARDRDGFLAAAGSAPRATLWARRTFAALERLDVSGFRLRLVGERGTAASATPRPRRGFTADVLVRWELDSHVSSASTVALSLADTGDAVSVLGLASGIDPRVTAGSPLPLWLAGHLGGRPGARCVGVDVAAGTLGCHVLTRVAEADLATLPARLRATHWFVVVPRSAAVAAALLGRPTAALRGVAAVTTTMDASASARAPALIVLNPAVMATLDRDAAQLVVSHEAVHAATGAAGVQLPLWVAEGFADYVALRAGRVPVHQAGSQILSRVRRTGPPVRLPPDAAFSAARSGVGRAYEAAWLVFRLLDERYGAPAAVAVYRAVLRGVSVNAALRRHVGVTTAQLTTAWRQSMRALAD